GVIGVDVEVERQVEGRPGAVATATPARRQAERREQAEDGGREPGGHVEPFPRPDPHQATRRSISDRHPNSAIAIAESQTIAANSLATSGTALSRGYTSRDPC